MQRFLLAEKKLPSGREFSRTYAKIFEAGQGSVTDHEPSPRGPVGGGLLSGDCKNVPIKTVTHNWVNMVHKERERR